MIENEIAIFDPKVDINFKKVVIQHEPTNENAIYDICSLEGRVLITGKFAGDCTEIDLEGYPEGLYNIFILDGEDVFKSSFRL